ncbi:kinase-like domain-containing protein [Thelephora terrestris]|uniref:Kinase-like domain-containing protein n=1 Tax=Thelephora terrestris TaxID=56493 RepID=A0A9P6H4P5_9AGAM|nr:kinase-like domain-containing protein [Thelephora terrestris]
MSLDLLRRLFGKDNDNHNTPRSDDISLRGAYGQRDRRAEAFRIVSRWRHLDQLDPELQDYALHLNLLLDDETDRKATTSLEGEDAIVVLDILAKALERVRNLEKLSNRVLLVLQYLAYKAGRIPNRYKIDRSLSFDMDPEAFASGGFSDVRRGDLGGQLVAVKILRIARSNDATELQKDFCKEAVLWKSISHFHPNILGLIAVDTDSTGRCFMISEFMVNGNIFEFIQRNSVNRLRLLEGVAEGIHYLHRLNISHGDIKGPNILITNATPPQACLSDFGFSVTSPTNSFPVSMCGMNLGGGTSPYTAPEILYPQEFGLRDSKLSKEGDIFAFGMTMYEVVTGVKPFRGKRHPEMLFAVTEGKRPEKPKNAEAIGFENGMWKLVDECWSQDRRQRPSARDVRVRLTFAASKSVPAPPGPRIPDPLAQSVKVRPPVFDSFGFANLFYGAKDKGAQIDPHASSIEGGNQYPRPNMDQQLIGRSMIFAREVVGGIHSSVPPAVRRGFGMLQGFRIRRFVVGVRAKLKFRYPRRRRDRTPPTTLLVT